MLPSARLPSLAVIVVFMLAGGLAHAQRARFPTAIQASQATPGTSTVPTYSAPAATAPPGSVAVPTFTAPGTTTVPTYAAPGTTTVPGYKSPAVTPAPPTTFSAPGASILPPGSSQPLSGAPTTYGSSPVASPGPAATLNGTILPPPSWDPYGAPGLQQQPSLLNQDPYLNPAFQLPPSVAAMQKLIQEVRLDYVYIPGSGGSDKFGSNDIELSSTFAFPFLYNQQNPLLVTPGFAMHFLSGPESSAANGYADMPGQVYDAYLDTTWRPQVTPWFGGELGFRIGVYSDFEKVAAESLRYTGEGLLVLTFSPSLKFKGGVVYLDRLRVKLLPAGGFVWTPNPDVRFDVLFPNPKLARRLTTMGTTDWWIYARGEYGGGNWAISRNGVLERVDYNDIRVAVGLDFARQRGLNGLIEVGISCDRELRYQFNDPRDFHPKPSVFLHTGLAF